MMNGKNGLFLLPPFRSICIFLSLSVASTLSEAIRMWSCFCCFSFLSSKDTILTTANERYKKKNGGKTHATRTKEKRSRSSARTHTKTDDIAQCLSRLKETNIIIIEARSSEQLPSFRSSQQLFGVSR